MVLNAIGSLLNPTLTLGQQASAISEAKQQAARVYNNAWANSTVANQIRWAAEHPYQIAGAGLAGLASADMVFNEGKGTMAVLGGLYGLRGYVPSIQKVNQAIHMGNAGIALHRNIFPKAHQPMYYPVASRGWLKGKYHRARVNRLFRRQRGKPLRRFRRRLVRRSRKYSGPLITRRVDGPRGMPRPRGMPSMINTPIYSLPRSDAWYLRNGMSPPALVRPPVVKYGTEPRWTVDDFGDFSIQKPDELR